MVASGSPFFTRRPVESTKTWSSQPSRRLFTLEAASKQLKWVGVMSAGVENILQVPGSDAFKNSNVVLTNNKVVQGIELLSSLPRGTGAMGFYEKPEQRVTIKSFKLASEVPEAQRTPLEELRTDTQTFTDYIDARRNRHEEWFKVPAGHVDVCNVPIPVRVRAAATGH